MRTAGGVCSDGARHDAPEERRALWVVRVTGTAMILLSVVLLAILPATPVGENLPGFASPVIGFELASRPEHVFGILGTPGDLARNDAVRRMDLGNRIDFLFLLAYAVFYAGFALLLRVRGRMSRHLTGVVLGLSVVMAVGDVLENLQLLTLSQLTDSAAMGPPLARLRVFTLLKWYAIYGASGIVALCVWREAGWWRWSAFFFFAAALLGFSSIVYLPGIEYGSALLIPAWIMTYIRSLRALPPVQASAKAP